MLYLSEGLWNFLSLHYTVSINQWSAASTFEIYGISINYMKSKFEEFFWGKTALIINILNILIYTYIYIYWNIYLDLKTWRSLWQNTIGLLLLRTHCSSISSSSVSSWQVTSFGHYNLAIFRLLLTIFHFFIIQERIFLLKFWDRDKFWAAENLLEINRLIL